MAKALIPGMILLISFLSNHSRAEEILFEVANIKAAGNTKLCTTTNVSSISSGSNIALVYDDVGIEFPSETERDGRILYNSCSVFGWLTIPQGYFIESYQNSINFGVVKTVGLEARVRSKFIFRSSIFQGQSLFLFQGFSSGEDINEPLVVLNDSKTISRRSQLKQCRITRRQDLRVSVLFSTDLRSTVIGSGDGTLIVGLDSADLNFDLSAVLMPCRSL